MALPDEHLARLEEGIVGHEERLRNVRLQIEALEDEASAHETVLALGRDRKLLATLHELSEEPRLAEQLARGARAFLAERGLTALDGATVTATSGDRGLDHVEATFATATLAYTVGWRRDHGFFVTTPGEETSASS